MLPIEDWQSLSPSRQQALLARPPQHHDAKKRVAEIIRSVRKEGDSALLGWTRELDGISLTRLQVSPEEIAAATISPQAMEAIMTAVKTITRFHQATLPENKRLETAPGVVLERIYRPIHRVGFYVPGGNKTPLVSSLLMQALPAQVAGCPLRVLCTPPNAEGNIDPVLLVVARLCHIENIYKIGGAQAIAAMAYGTETVPKVDKIFGPGNAYVTEAKVQVSSDVGGAAIDMPAGPSEVMILADASANPAFVAADLLAQAEHGADSQVFLLCEDRLFAEAVHKALLDQYQHLTRQALIKKSLRHSAILLCQNRSMMIEIANQYAPEHLMIQCVDATCWVDSITAAGTIFLGSWAAETLGDYVTGSNHILPTYGFARHHSGLSTGDFMKSISVQSISEEGLKALGESARTLAMIEGLDAHANAITQRLQMMEETE
ncbi:MAG: histidinol dehydrogenase [Chthoniobacterales bacterium]